jgi:hypothetical protein
MSTVIKLDPVVELPKDIEERCAERLRVARGHMTASVENYIEAGREFAAIKREIPHGYWKKWCEANGLAYSTTNKLAEVGERFAGELLTISNHSKVLIDVGALFQLAEPHVPQPAIKEAVARAAKGEHITKPVAKTIVEKAKAAPKQPEPVAKQPPAPAKKSKPVEVDMRPQDFQVAVYQINDIEPWHAGEIADARMITLDECRQAVMLIQDVIQAIEAIDAVEKIPAQ